MVPQIEPAASLCKLVSRTLYNTIQGLWFTNESISHLINALVIKDEYLYLGSGLLLTIMSWFILKHYRIDPIDQNLILNEQAINLTA